jgi:hypothetical protein
MDDSFLRTLGRNPGLMELLVLLCGGGPENSRTWAGLVKGRKDGRADLTCWAYS